MIFRALQGADSVSERDAAGHQGRHLLALRERAAHDAGIHLRPRRLLRSVQQQRTDIGLCLNRHGSVHDGQVHHRRVQPDRRLRRRHQGQKEPALVYPRHARPPDARRRLWLGSIRSSGCMGAGPGHGHGASADGRLRALHRRADRRLPRGSARRRRSGDGAVEGGGGGRAERRRGLLQQQRSEVAHRQGHQRRFAVLYPLLHPAEAEGRRPLPPHQGRGRPAEAAPGLPPGI